MEEVTGQNLISRRNTMGSSWDDEFVSDDRESYLTGSSFAPDVVETLTTPDSSKTIITIVVVSVSVLIVIAALFLLAVFVDYRQQKLLDQQQCIVKKRKSFKLRLPHCRRVRQPTGIVEDAEEIGHTSPPLEIISEVV